MTERMTSTESQTPNATPAPASDGRPTAAALAALIAGGLAFAVSCAVVFSPAHDPRAEYDQEEFHRVAIEQFAADWPAVDLGDYASATTPAYHLIMAAALRYVADDLSMLRLIGSLFTVGLLATLAGWIAYRRSAAAGVVFTLPLLASLYVIASAGWLLPDNAGWWTAAAAIMLALSSPVRPRTLIAFAILFVIVVLFRQVHAWVVFPMLAAAACRPPGTGDAAAGAITPRDRLRGLAGAGLAALPAVAALGAFVWLWGGLVPPRFHDFHASLSPIAPAFILALLAIYSVPFAPWLFRRGPDAAPRFGRAEILTLLAALALAAIPLSSYDVEAGRSSGLWNLLRMTPAIADRSPLLIALAGLGGVALVRWLRGLPPRDRWVMLLALLGFTLSQIATGHAWQRYSEPLLLIWIALALGRTNRLLTRPAMLGAATAAALLASVSIAKLAM